MAALLLIGSLLATPPALAATGGLLLQVGGPSSPFTDSPPPVFSGSSILPGGSIVGEVSAENESGVTGALSLRTVGVVERGDGSTSPGSFDCNSPGGLAAELDLQVWDVTGASREKLYDGSVCQLEARNTLVAKTLEKGTNASFTVIAALPRSAGNDLMGASAAWTFVWQLTATTGGVLGSVDVSARSSAGQVTATGHSAGALAFTGTSLEILLAVGLAAILAGVCIGLVSEVRRGSCRIGEPGRVHRERH